jgi:hypothetical protein
MAYPETLETAIDICFGFLTESNIFYKDVNIENNSFDITQEQLKRLNEVIKSNFMELNDAPINLYYFIGAIRNLSSKKVIIDNDIWEKCLEYLEVYENSNLQLWKSVESLEETKKVIKELKTDISNKIKPTVHTIHIE